MGWYVQRRERTVNDVGEVAAGRLDAAVAVALVEALPHVEVLTIVRRQDDPLAQRLRMQALTQVQRTVRTEAERPTAVLWVYLLSAQKPVQLQTNRTQRLAQRCFT